MSGGHFDYWQYHIGEIANSIECVIVGNNERQEPFSKATIAKFKRAVKHLREAEVMAHRVDYLLSGDDGEESFHRRLQEDLNKLRSK